MIFRQVQHTIILTIIFLLLSVSTVFGQDNKNETDKIQTRDSDPESVDQLKYSQLRPHWFNFIWYSGGGLLVGDLTMKTSGESDNKDQEYTADLNGATGEHMAHFLFYPEKHRRFILGLGLGVGDGVGRLLALDDESEFLDHKHYEFTYVVLPIIIGYRLFFGQRQEVSFNMSADLAAHSSYFQIEGSEEEINSTGASFAIHLGAHYRFSSGFLLGGEWRFRYYEVDSDEAKIVGHPVKIDVDGGLGTIGLLVGFEPL